MTYLSLLLGLAIPAALAWAYHATMDIAPLWIWLISINLVLLGLMGKDKLAARKKGARTPEITLLVLTFAGGTPAMMLGRKLFRHKTVKQEFLYALWGTLAAQLACIVYFHKTLLHWL